VSPRKLDALENDRWDELPDATFARALAQTVCRALKIDARPVLDLLPPVGAVALEPGNGGLNAPFHAQSGRDTSGLAGAAVRPLVLAALLLLVAAGVVYFLPVGIWSPGEPAPVAASSAAVDAAAAAPSPAEVAASAATEVAEAASDAVQAAASQPAGETVLATPPPESAGSAGAAAAAGQVQLRTSAPSWIDVRDASGQVLLSRIVQPGENVGLDGAVPIRLVIGNAAATELGFRGQPVDLAPHTRDNVARIELP
jgi:cytoskeleton protein RodZ